MKSALRFPFENNVWFYASSSFVIVLYERSHHKCEVLSDGHFSIENMTSRITDIWKLMVLCIHKIFLFPLIDKFQDDKKLKTSWNVRASSSSYSCSPI